MGVKNDTEARMMLITGTDLQVVLTPLHP